MSNQTQSGTLKITIYSDPSEARRVHESIEEALRFNSFPEHDIFSIRLAVEEAIINAMKHGNQLDRTKKVQVQFLVSPERFEIQVQDEGPGFDPEDIPDPMAPENLERDCGRGVLLMRHYMSEVQYKPPGNVVSMVKLRNGQHP